GPGPNGPGPEENQRSEGPAPSVARISMIYGDVSTQRGDTGDWAATSVNAPVMRGDQIATGEKARTEIQLDYADILRLAARSQVKIADITRDRIQVQVAQGYASYSVMKGGEADVEIDTPNVAVHPLKLGRYRVQVNSDSSTDVIVREGEAEITTPQGSTRVHEGELITIRGTDNPEYKISAAPEKDDWDRWNLDRDRVIRDAEGPRRTNRYYTGASDLDGYGHWVYVPGYGNVWQPYQQVNWAPYQAGRWVWEPFYGWTWVSYEPWGWAPYHYGRWFFYGGNWCWWPGPVFVGYRPLWSPAFVTFIGFGPHVGVGFGFGSIGWFPVGPHDYFYPWYGRGFNRVNVVSITNINVVGRGGFIAPLAVRGRQPFFSNANLVLTNPRVRASITSVSAGEFGHGTPGAFRRGVDEHELRESRVMTANLPVVPSRESLHASRGNAAVPATVHPANTGRFFTQHQPPAGPESFHSQVERVQRITGNEVPGAHGTEMRGTAASERREPIGSAAGRSGPPQSMANRQGTVNRSEGNAENSNRSNGWNRFGGPSGASRGNAEIGRSGSGTPTSRSTDIDRTSRTESGAPSRGTDRGMQNASPRMEERPGSFQRFPSNPAGNPGTRSSEVPTNRGGESGGGKPPLDLHRPIVTPRQQPEPRGNMPSRGSEPRTSRSESRGGGERGGHESRSSSSPKR
ncbi:MAG TPA: DUF6600 domain-containing protein, partial [Candidatus Angelobacter sp.]|nr:DUF6600 domain-containing protein [Candidatus Angelobacter sp.]